MATLRLGEESGLVPVVVQAPVREFDPLSVPGLDMVFPSLWRGQLQKDGELNFPRTRIKFDKLRVLYFKNVVGRTMVV